MLPICPTAHPRSRGENAVTINGELVSLGSSPLTRGKRCTGTSPHSAMRLIPAHAGKTGSRPRGLGLVRAHPRSRGENDSLHHTLAFRSGSSPLTRGKPGLIINDLNTGGLIPAHAGKTSCVASHQGTSQAHPRSRGENCLCVPVVEGDAGSSPLTRGKLGSHAPLPHMSGLIPAHAGKTCGQRVLPICPTAHPRSRGENANPVATVQAVAGSSPLTRGKLNAAHHAADVIGLIPAHAGKT